MAQLAQDLVNRLNEISSKLDKVSEGFTTFTESINKLGENIEKSLGELINKIGEYADIVSTKSQEDFEVSKAQIMSINEQIDKIRKGVGMEQMLKISESLSGMLNTLGGAEFNPNELKNKLSDLKTYIKSKKK